MNNLMQGQNLQNAYTAQPFSALQNQAYANQGNQSNYMRALVPGLLTQLSQQPLAYDRSNQNARPQAFDFASGDTLKGLLAQMASGQSNAPPIQNTPQVTPPKADEGAFAQQNGIVSGMNMSSFDGQNMYGSGGYGTFKYGMPTPQPGTQQYRDMSAYFANGGVDPNNYYGKGADYKDSNANPLAYMWGGGQVNGGVGIGDTGANAAASASGNDGW
ncbi:hypothetical protein [Variovorax sp. YR752]|uniref:hypothetical protein n=1 Tax=Variovorax sp. YR752 TaxID=1884383 RepID=UPI003137EA66